MDRRTFLQAGVATAGVAGSSCVGVKASTGEETLGGLSENDLLAALGRMDKGLRAVDVGNVVADFLPEVPIPNDPRKMELSRRGNELGRKSMRMLLLTGAVSDLPQAAQLDPRVQDRIVGALPEMDEAMLGMTDFLAELSSEERGEIKQAMIDRPELLDDIGLMMDRQAAEADVPMKRRLHLRSLVKEIGWRMQQQSPGAVIDHYVEKVRKVEERHGADAQAQRAMAAEVTQQLLWAQNDAPTPPPLVPTPAGPPPQGMEGQPSDAPPPPPPPLGSEESPLAPTREHWEGEPVKPRRGAVPMTVGGILLGFGAATLVVSGIVAATDPYGYASGFVLIGITVGAALALAGSIVLLIGGILWATTKPPEH